MTMPVLPAGHIPTADELAAWSDQIDALTNPPETDWAASVAWTSSGTAPALGNAVKVAKYWRTPNGLWVDTFQRVTFGTTSTFGTGVHFWSLPVTAAADQVASAIGEAYGLDAGTQEYTGVIKLESATTCRVIPAEDTSATNWGQTSPFTWGNGDSIVLTARYRAA